MAEKLEIVVGAQDQFSATFSKLKTAIAGAVAAYASFKTVQAVSTMLKETADQADGFSKLQDRLGFTTETLSKLAYAAKLADVDFGSMSMGLQFMLKNTSEAARGNEQLQDTISRLGLSLEALKRMSPDEMFNAYAAAIARIQNPAERANIAMEFFGRGGAVMLQMLKDGADGLDKMSAEAERFGVVISQQAAYNAAEFNDSLTRMGQGIDGIRIALTKDFLPYLTAVFNRLAYFIADNRQVIADWASAFIKSLGSALRGFMEFSAQVVGGFYAIKAAADKTTLDSNTSSIKNYLTQIDELGKKSQEISAEMNSGAWDKQGQRYKELADSLASVTQRIESLRDRVITLNADNESLAISWTENSNKMFAGEKARAFFQELTDGLENLKNEGSAVLPKLFAGAGIRGDLTSKMKGQIEGLKDQYVQIFGTASQQIERWREKEIANAKGNKEALLLIESIYQGKLIQARDEMEKTDRDYLKSLEDQYASIAGKGDQYRISELAKLEIWYGEQMALHGANEEARAALENLYSEKRKEAVQADADYEIAVQLKKIDMIANMLGGFAALSAQLGKKMFLVSKALSIGQAIMSTYTGAANAMKDVPYPFNFVAAAAVIAYGMAQVAQIAKQKPPGAKKGVDFVPADQTYQLHKGERVVPAETNKDLRSFLENGGSGVQIGSFTLNLPNVRSIDDLKRMSDREWQDLIEQKMIPNFRRLAGAGIAI